MSGDVQPRKRKDKKKKKDDLGVEEPRGTAAPLGEGDVFMHSQSDHGTGGHWCAKVIFFSLLAVLLTLIGLIILENRGLTDLDANSVESRYSGVLEGWIEDAPDDDHHDEHTLELKHHDNEDHGNDLQHDDHEDDDEHDENDDDEHNDDEHDENDDNEEHEDDENEGEHEENDDEHDDDEDDDVEREPEADDIESTEDSAEKNDENDDDDNIDNNEDDDDENDRDDDDDNSIEEVDDDDDNAKDGDDNIAENGEDNDVESAKDDDEDEVKQNNSVEDEREDNDDSEENDYLQNDAAEEDEDEHEEAEETNSVEIEPIESEVPDDGAASTEEPAEEDDNDAKEEVSEELSPEASLEDDDVEFLEPDELDELPVAEPISVPKGKPLPEVEDSPSTERPQDTLADEEEYERRQDELRKEREQASQGMWLKLTVGGALLVATHAVLRRATASRETETEDEPDTREETPLSDRRMTLIPEPEETPTVAPKAPEVKPKVIEVVKEAPIIKSAPPKEESEEEDEEIVSKPAQLSKQAQEDIERELYSDEEIEEDEDIEEEEDIVPIKSVPQQAVPQAPIPDVTKEVTPEPDEDDDVEIIDEEQFEEELEEEEISDVDDAELLNRLEEKYGRLPDTEPQRPPRHKDGGNSIEEDDWPGEPADAFWNEHLEEAQRQLREGDWSGAMKTAGSPRLASSARARFILAQALDAAAEAKKDNQLLSKAIAAYLEVLKMNERLSDEKLLMVTSRTLDRIKFRGTYLSAEPIYKLLIRRFPNEPAYRNNLTISLLMANRNDLAENVLKETLKLWPNDRVALAHYAFILKTLHNRLEEAVEVFSKALEGDAGDANEPRFYYHWGDALLLLGRYEQAHKVHQRGAELGHFLSPSQRSLYNVDRLKSKPWWDVNQTPYIRLAQSLEKSWKEILKEGEAAKALFEKEKEGLKERGKWTQLDLFVRGREVPNRCSRAPVTCGIVKSEVGASGCRRGQIKFSMMEAGTHVRPHVGPTNCRLRMHLGLSNTRDTFLRVDQETRQWQLGKVLMFDDSFEHEVWHNGSLARLVLIVDVWHPDLTRAERAQLPAI